MEREPVPRPQCFGKSITGKPDRYDPDRTQKGPVLGDLNSPRRDIETKKIKQIGNKDARHLAKASKVEIKGQSEQK